MPADTTITQYADIKVLMPILQEAMRGSEGALNLNMVGPIYITSEKGDNLPRQLPDPTGRIKYQEVSSDDLFSDDMSLKDFKDRATGMYFRVLCSRHDFNREKTQAVLRVSNSLICQLAKRYGVIFRLAKHPGALIMQNQGETT